MKYNLHQVPISNMSSKSSTAAKSRQNQHNDSQSQSTKASNENNKKSQPLPQSTQEELKAPALLDPSWKSDVGTNLMRAVANGYEDIVRWLVEQAKADVNFETKNRFTALILAARSGYTGIVRILLDHKAHVDHQDHKGMTAVSWASFSGMEDTVRVLLEYGANIYIPDDIGFTALDWAISESKEDCYNLLAGRSSSGFSVRAKNAFELWNHLSYKERRLYRKYWEEIVQYWASKVPFQDAIEFFLRSDLPQSLVLDIWSKCCQGRDYLDIYGFLLVLRYIALAQRSRALINEYVLDLRRPLIPRFAMALPRSEKRRPGFISELNGPGPKMF